MRKILVIHAHMVSIMKIINVIFVAKHVLFVLPKQIVHGVREHTMYKMDIVKDVLIIVYIV